MTGQSRGLAAVTGMGMAFVGGYVDVVGFVLLFGLFVNHATGNLVMLGVALAGGDDGIMTKLLSLPVFVAVAAAAYALIRRRRARGLASDVMILLLQAALLTAFMLLTVRALPAAGADQPAVMLAGLVGVGAMAVQNVGARVIFSDLAPTTIMTGNVTQIAIDLVDLLSAKSAMDEALITRIIKTWPPVMAFALGVACGAIGVLVVGAWSLLAPTTVVMALAVARRTATSRVDGGAADAPALREQTSAASLAPLVVQFSGMIKPVSGLSSYSRSVPPKPCPAFGDQEKATCPVSTTRSPSSPAPAPASGAPPQNFSPPKARP